MSILLWLLCLVWVRHAAAVCGVSCQAAQKISLEQFYNDLDGPRWGKQQGWLQPGQPHCSWQGVRCCDSSNVLPGTSTPCPVAGGVAGLDLAGNNLTGPWPAAALSGLSDSLVQLNLRSNKLSGNLPSSISNLGALSKLNIDNNKLTGPLPASMGQLANLTQFSAAGNKLSGALPAGLSDAQQLQWLLLDSNQLTGSVDPALLQLPQLEVLNLQDNRLSGPLPDLNTPGMRKVVWGLRSDCRRGFQRGVVSGPKHAADVLVF